VKQVIVSESNEAYLADACNESQAEIGIRKSGRKEAVNQLYQFRG